MHLYTFGKMFHNLGIKYDDLSLLQLFSTLDFDKDAHISVEVSVSAVWSASELWTKHHDLPLLRLCCTFDDDRQGCTLVCGGECKCCLVGKHCRTWELIATLCLYCPYRALLMMTDKDAHMSVQAIDKSHLQKDFSDLKVLNVGTTGCMFVP